MIENFAKVTNNIFRGGAPSIKDLSVLKNKFEIKKIISLDSDVAKRIDRACKLLEIKHITVPIDVFNKSSLIHLLNANIVKLLSNGPTFIHCLHGKDRTGCAIALFRIIKQNWSCTKALKEANKFGFGVGVEPRIVNFYKKIMQKFCKYDHQHISEDDNSAYDIVSNEREDLVSLPYDNDKLSWSPYEDYRIRQFPYTGTEKDWPEQYETRNNYGLDDSIFMHPEHVDIPQSGTYDTSTDAIQGFGPSLVGGGFV